MKNKHYNGENPPKVFRITLLLLFNELNRDHEERLEMTLTESLKSRSCFSSKYGSEVCLVSTESCNRPVVIQRTEGDCSGRIY